MRRKTKTLLSAAAALAAAPAIPAAAIAAQAVPPATSYAELLQPISNAQEKLRRSDLERADPPAQLVRVQWRAHHHHHHHHHHNRAWYLRNGYAWMGGAWVLRPRHHHHHHHHHQHY